eukprot:g4099.t1
MSGGHQHGGQHQFAALAVAEKAGALTGSLVGATTKLLAAGATSVLQTAASELGANTGIGSDLNTLASSMTGPPGGGTAGNTELYNAMPDARPPEVVVDTTKPVFVQIKKTETKLSYLLQEYTDYVIEVHDFGKERTVSHRFNDFFTLHAALSPLDLNLPVLPQKGMDSTDPLVVEDRKAKLSIFLQYCLNSEVIRLEKNLHIWKFLEFENAGFMTRDQRW